MTATQTWRELLRTILADGVRVEQTSAGATFRGRTSIELLAHRTVWPMARAVVACPDRKIGYRFLAAEAAWVLSGSNLLADVVRFAPRLADLSDDGVHLFGAYGPMYREQLPYVLKALATDQMTRQAISVIWRPRPGQQKDIPCTVALQWVIRPTTPEAPPAVHCVASMRSSDAWLGVPYDVHTFSMLSAHVALHLRDRFGPIALGNLYLTAGSQHLYVMDAATAEKCVFETRTITPAGRPEGVQVTAVREDEVYADGGQIDLTVFNKPDGLIEHLRAVADRDPSRTIGSYLKETWA